jgi:DNA-binding response OmpR family regulator
MAHILIVDDDPMIQELIKDVLVVQNHTFDLASKGVEALQKVKTKRFDLMILDRSMPEMDGLQVLKALRASPEGAGLKVLMCTAADMMADAEAAFLSGATDYIVKPLDLAKLSAKVTLLTRKS